MPFLGAPPRPDASPGGRHLAAGLLLFAPLVLAGNEIGSVFRYPDTGTAVLFAPYALLTAVLVVSRPGDWVWYILLDSIAHFVAHWPQWPLTWVLLANVANLARALTAALVITRLFSGPPRLVSTRALWLFLVSSVVAAPSVGATIGAANVVLHGDSMSYWQAWIAWFLSNAITGLTMLPACIGLFAYTAGWYPLRTTRERVLEMLLLGVALCATCALVFFGGLGPQHLALPLSAALPILIWSALRFGAFGASVTLTVVTFAAIWSLDRGTGLVLGPPGDSILALQVFVLFTSVPVLCLAAVATARQGVVQLHQALLASVHDHVAILDANGVVLEVNESWRRFAESCKAPLFHRVRGGDDYLTACRSSADKGDVTATGVLDGVTSVLGRVKRRFEIDFDYRDDDRHESYTMSVEALERSDGGAVVRRVDVTARRQAQMEIEEQRRELSHLARVSMLGQLSGAFAHELNQPLTAILSNAETARELLRREPANLDYVAAILRDIIADDRRAAAMIYRLRGLLKRGVLRFQLIETIDLLGEVLALARTELIARRIEATVAVNPDVPIVWGDKVQLQQVLLNLILNGCEAMGGAQGSIRRIVLTVDRDGPHNAHFAIRDSGTGLPPDQIDRLFEPFVTTKPNGLGLGLSISRTIVAAHGGRMWGENNPDGGATMHCVLPLTAPSPSQIDAAVAIHGAVGQSL